VHGLARERLRRRALPALEGEVLGPAVEPRPVPPRRLDHRGDPAVPPRQQALDDRRLAVVVPVADRPAVSGAGAHPPPPGAQRARGGPGGGPPRAAAARGPPRGGGGGVGPPPRRPPPCGGCPGGRSSPAPP